MLWATLEERMSKRLIDILEEGRESSEFAGRCSPECFKSQMDFVEELKYQMDDGHGGKTIVFILMGFFNVMKRLAELDRVNGTTYFDIIGEDKLIAICMNISANLTKCMDPYRIKK